MGSDVARRLLTESFYQSPMVFRCLAIDVVCFRRSQAYTRFFHLFVMLCLKRLRLKHILTPEFSELF